MDAVPVQYEANRDLPWSEPAHDAKGADTSSGVASKVNDEAVCLSQFRDGSGTGRLKIRQEWNENVFSDELDPIRYRIPLNSPLRGCHYLNHHATGLFGAPLPKQLPTCGSMEQNPRENMGVARLIDL